MIKINPKKKKNEEEEITSIWKIEITKFYFLGNYFGKA